MPRTLPIQDRPAWSLALAAAAILGTLATACMMPFVGLAVAAAATMTRGRAALTIVGVWAFNQLLGFGLLGYPLTPYALAWGAALGAGSLIAMLVAKSLLGRTGASPARLVIAFVTAFAAYEVALFGFALAAGGTNTFTPRIIAQIGANDAVWFVALTAFQFILTKSAPRLFGTPLLVRAAA